MTSHDDEIDDFLRKRRPLFGRDHELEPPIEIDRVVLRQAREAIESERPQRVFRAPAWSMPVALAATLVLVFTIILRIGTHEVVRKPEVTVQHISRQVEIPAAAAPPPPDMARAAAPAEAPSTIAAPASGDSAVLVDLGAGTAKPTDFATAPSGTEPRARRLEKVADTAQSARDLVSGPEAARYSQPMGAGAGRSTAGDSQASTSTITHGQRTDPAAGAAPKPEYRRDARTWLAEIDRLRAAGEAERADAELAEYKREHRAYAVAPDR